HRGTHRAFLVPLKPDPGSERDNYYLYDVVFNGETIVSDSRVPEFDACRVLLARSLTGTLVLADAVTGKNRLSLDIEHEPSSRSERTRIAHRALRSGSHSTARASPAKVALNTLINAPNIHSARLAIANSEPMEEIAQPGSQEAIRAASKLIHAIKK